MTALSAARRRPAVFALAAALTLAGCGGVTTPFDGVRADFQVPSRFAGFPASQPVLLDGGWLQTFASPQLSALVAEALANNRDLRAAAARMDEARARARQAGAAGFPTVTAALDAESRSDPGVDSVDLDVGVVWEADLWGRIRGNRTAAALDAVATESLFEAARQSIAAEVVRLWVLINGNRMLIGVADSEVAARRSTASDIRSALAEQAALAVDSNRAEAELALAQRRLVTARAQLQASERALEVLLGRYPAGSVVAGSGLPRIPSIGAVGVPAQLLERRPDVQAAERQVAAAFYRRSEAQAARLPRLTLRAGAGSEGQDFAEAFEADNIIWSIAGGLIAPIFDAGRLAEEVNVATARQAAALAAYGNVALVAFREVEDALASEQSLTQELTYLNRAERELRSAIRLEEERYRAGEVLLATVSDVRLDFYNVQRAIVEAQVARLINRVQLHLALGGSFDPSAPLAEDTVASVAPGG